MKVCKKKSIIKSLFGDTSHIFYQKISQKIQYYVPMKVGVKWSQSDLFI